MTVSTDEFLQAKEAAQALLERLGLDAYLFEVEPREGLWELRVECAIEGGWQTTSLLFEKKLLLASPRDTDAAERLLSEWRERLAACKVTPKKTI